MALQLRYMRLDDVPAVVAIDQEAFSTPWSARSYAYEVGESRHSYMVVLEDVHIPARLARPSPARWRRWLGALGWGRLPVRRGNAAELLAYGGLWHIADEAHISTIAVGKQWRGRGYGEIALAAMLRRSIVLRASYVVLEVRVSNAIAQNLYHKYGFQSVAVKKNYYRDDGEDAYDMRVDLTPDYCERFNERYEALLRRFSLTDCYSEQDRP